MSADSTGKTPNAAKIYADIIDHPHWQSPVRPHMSMLERAAQFAPYDALTGYSDMIAEEARWTDMQATPDDEALDDMNRQMNELAENIGNGGHPTVTFTIFVPDERKQGGQYMEWTDQVLRIDPVAKTVVLMSRKGRGGQRRQFSFEQIAAMKIWRGEREAPVQNSPLP